MPSLGVDQRQETSTDTGPAPSVPSASVAPAPTSQPLSTSEDRKPPAVERKIAVLGPTLRFKGDISAEEDFILQGRIQGTIHHTQSIIIGTGGSVLGNVYARLVVIDGTVEGDLHGVESVVVHETGRVIGNIYAPRVGLVEGSVFNGRIDMTGTAVASQGTNAGAGQGVGNLAAKRRIESPTMSPGKPMSAEETEKVLATPAPTATPKTISVLPPPPRREKAG
jgi:cytoskeletal protein CcmA (bactofilin family)